MEQLKRNLKACQRIEGKYQNVNKDYLLLIGLCLLFSIFSKISMINAISSKRKRKFIF